MREPLRSLLAPDEAHDICFGFLVRVFDENLHEEAVPLSFGSRSGPLLRDRVLSRHDHGELGKFVGRSCYGP